MHILHVQTVAQAATEGIELRPLSFQNFSKLTQEETMLYHHRYAQHKLKKSTVDKKIGCDLNDSTAQDLQLLIFRITSIHEGGLNLVLLTLQ